MPDSPSQTVQSSSDTNLCVAAGSFSTRGSVSLSSKVSIIGNVQFLEVGPESSLVLLDSGTSITMDKSFEAYANFSSISTDGISKAPTSALLTSYEVFYAFSANPIISDSTTEPAAYAIEAMNHILRITSQIYVDVTKKCQALMDGIDFSDDESRGEAISRLCDVLEPFGSVLATVFAALLRDRRSKPIAISFLIKDLLPHLDNTPKAARLAAIWNVLSDSKPSTRYAAVEALEILGGSDSKRLLAEHHIAERNKLVLAAIDASLSAG